MTLLETMQLLGSVGEFVGAIAVLATLIFLSIQVRHGSNLMEENIKTRQLESVNQYILFMGDFRSSIYTDQELAEIWRNKDGELSETHQMRVYWCMADFVMRSRGAYMSCQLSGLEAQMKNAARVVADEIAVSPLFLDVWKAMSIYHREVSPDFVNAVNNRIEEIGT